MTSGRSPGRVPAAPAGRDDGDPITRPGRSAGGDEAKGG
jgi:hypothetical protein